MSTTNSNAGATSTPLQAQLDAFTAKTSAFYASKLTPAEIETVKAQFVDKENPFPVPQPGTQAPLFSLTDNNGKIVSLSDLVASGKHTILVWYRGEWCPYCQMTLKALNEYLPQYTSLNAQLYAITPTLPALTPTTIEKFNLQFSILSDLNNIQAKAYGSLYQLSEDMTSVHEKLGMKWDDYYGTGVRELPHASTFIIEGNSGKIVYSKVSMDYRKRIEPSEIIEELKKLQK